MTPATDSRLRERAWHTLTRAKKPLTAKDLAESAQLTTGGALVYLREWSTTGRLAALPAPGHPAPYLDRYDTPALLTRLDLDRSPTTMTPTTLPPAAPAHAPDVFRVLITGSRTWTREGDLTSVLDGLLAEHGDRLVLIHGACPRGADAIAAGWATRHHVATVEVPADWDQHNRRAGIIRNSAMVAAGADLCLAFIRDDSPGATHCASIAEAAGIPVRRYVHDTRHTRVGQTPTGPAMLTAALAYAERGWHVFPLVPGEKRPAVKDWEARATTDPARIQRCWSTIPPAGPYGIGIACGPSGLVVIDLDQPKPDQDPTPPAPFNVPGIHDGGDVFTLICETAGMPVPWDTYAVNTGRGGTHLYYRHATRADGWDGPLLRNTAGTLGWLIDTRAAGGYVVAPPTVVNDLPYTLGHDAPTAPLPLWLAKHLAPEPLPTQEPVHVALSVVSGAGGDARRDAYLESALDRQLESVLAAGEGSRNRALYLSAVALGQLIAGGELNGPTVTARLETTARIAGLNEREIPRTITSGLRAGTKRPRTLTTTRKAA